MGTDSGPMPFIVQDKGSIHPTMDERMRSGQILRGGKARIRANANPRPALTLAYPRWHDKVLQTGDFFEAVNRETRRSERSKTPLSIVRYSINEAAADEPLHFEQLFAVLQHAKRETDFLGHIGTETLAVLCPDTDDQGVRGFMAKLAPLLGELPIKSASATYPEDLFDSLARGTSVSAAFHSFILPTAAVNNVGHYTLKSTIDVILASLALLLLSPLMLAVAIAVKLTSRGPMIFKQARLGKAGIPFTFYKFRSMRVNTDDAIHRAYTASLIRAGETGPTAGMAAGAPAVYKMKADPRVTWIGGIIRKTSLDELPQLFNVLKGDMSMVGPRPCIPYEAENYEPWHLRRILAAKPGITGVWQVEGRSKVTFSEMVRMDLRYIRECSLGLDLKILMKTVAVVIRCDGAT
jgi:lipopolysaccharide/colanic/teichoic acid biosynthesis glycosyltransferase